MYVCYVCNLGLESWKSCKFKDYVKYMQLIVSSTGDNYLHSKHPNLTHRSLMGRFDPNVTCNSLIYSLVRCKPSLAWMNLKALKMMGPYISSLSPNDVDSSPKEQVRGSAKEGQRDKITNDEILIGSSVGSPLLFSLLALYFFPISPVQIRHKNDQKDETQPGHEVKPEISRVR